MQNAAVLSVLFTVWPYNLKCYSRWIFSLTKESDEEKNDAESRKLNKINEYLSWHNVCVQQRNNFLFLISRVFQNFCAELNGEKEFGHSHTAKQNTEKYIKINNIDAE